MKNRLDLRPLSVKIDGELALVHVYSIWFGTNYNKRANIKCKEDDMRTFFVICLAMIFLLGLS